MGVQVEPTPLVTVEVHDIDIQIVDVVG
jgi:hypothetical protein